VLPCSCFRDIFRGSIRPIDQSDTLFSPYAAHENHDTHCSGWCAASLRFL